MIQAMAEPTLDTRLSKDDQKAEGVATGQFVALPAQADAMYDLRLWGHSESTDIQINK
jgi:hypothetical protein